MTLTTHHALAPLNAREWNVLAGDNPFVSHTFLNTLETTGCVSADTGWQPQHLVLHDAHGTLQAAMPLYLKTHSYGEFVFDWAWAHAYQAHGLAYYPKLVCAVPFSPVTGPRIMGDAPAFATLAEAVEQRVEQQNLSSAHCLFSPYEQAQALAERGWLLRRTCQFHWHNRGFDSFDAFLATLTASKRKKLRRERRRVTEAGITFRTVHGDALNDALLDDIYLFYCRTYAERGQRPYLNRAFWPQLARALGRALVVFVAMRDGRPIACAICLKSGDTLYGRHWGAIEHWHSLHFETCYYQGIDYCIRHGLAHFNPGAQGQHKLSRGFEPTLTHSAHWIAHADFRDAIARFVVEENAHIGHYYDEACTHLPFK